LHGKLDCSGPVRVTVAIGALPPTLTDEIVTEIPREGAQGGCRQSLPPHAASGSEVSKARIRLIVIELKPWR
jgi:hypothetical protein